MAINLSANTKTTGPVSQEVFDPNIGFKSGLEGLARGIGQAGQVAGNLSKQIHTKNDNASKQLAATNFRVLDTQMRSDFSKLETLKKDPNSTKESIADALAATDRYKEFDYSLIDPESEVSEDYYTNYTPVLQASYNAHKSNYDVIIETQNQMKAVGQRREEINKYDAALTGPPSADSYVSQVAGVVVSLTSEEDPIFALNNPDTQHKTLLSDLGETLTTTISRLSEITNTKQQEVELLKIQDSLSALSATGNPRAQKSVDTALTTVKTALKAIGVEGSKERKNANKAQDAQLAEDAKLFSDQIKTDPVTGAVVGKVADQKGFGAVFAPMSEDASDTDIASQNKAVADLAAVRTADNGNTYIGNAIQASYAGEEFKELPDEAYILRAADGQRVVWDKTELQKDADTFNSHNKKVEEGKREFEKGIANNDFSVLAKIDPFFAKQWKLLHSTEDEGVRSTAWRRLSQVVAQYKNNPDFVEVFRGTRAFGILPEDNGTSFSSMDKDGKLEYIKEMRNLNGHGSYAFSQNLQNSNSSDQTLGVMLALELDGLAEEALEYASIGTSIYGGASFTMTDADGEVSLQSASVNEFYKSLKLRGLETPLDTHMLSADRQGNRELSMFYDVIERGQIAKAIQAKRDGTTMDVYNLVLDMQDGFVKSLGNKIFTENDTIISMPAFDPSNELHRNVLKHFERADFFTGGMANQYGEAVSNLLVESLLELEVPTTLLSEMLEAAGGNPALQEALSGMSIDNMEEAKKLARGLSSSTATGGLPYVDYSDITTENGVDYIIPRFKKGKGTKYEPFEYTDGSGATKILKLPLNGAHRKVAEQVQANVDFDKKYFDWTRALFPYTL